MVFCMTARPNHRCLIRPIRPAVAICRMVCLHNRTPKPSVSYPPDPVSTRPPRPAYPFSHSCNPVARIRLSARTHPPVPTSGGDWTDNCLHDPPSASARSPFSHSCNPAAPIRPIRLPDPTGRSARSARFGQHPSVLIRPCSIRPFRPGVGWMVFCITALPNHPCPIRPIRSAPVRLGPPTRSAIRAIRSHPSAYPPEPIHLFRPAVAIYWMVCLHGLTAVRHAE